MAEIFPLRPSEHDAVQRLLPWYVNGTLSEAEAGRVDAHLAECGECRDELAFEWKLAHSVAMLPLNADDGWNAMQARMTQTVAETGNVVRVPFGLLRRRVPMGWAMAASMAASVALAFIMTSIRPVTLPQSTYHTLGSHPVVAEGQVVVLFRPDTTEQQMRVVLSSQSARLVDGPTTAGAYVLHIDGSDPGKAIDALRRSSQIVLAEPLANDGRP